VAFIGVTAGRGCDGGGTIPPCLGVAGLNVAGGVSMSLNIEVKPDPGALGGAEVNGGVA
jgi:hypothetical protein